MIKITFKAFDRELTEYFPIGTTEEEYRAVLFERCYTYVIINICIIDKN